MLQPGSKSKWWYPILMFFTPGVCYLYAAVFPNFRKDFAIAGIIIMTVNIILAVWRVISPRHTDTHVFRSITAHGFTLAVLLIACQFWVAFFPMAEALIIVIMSLLYLVGWCFPILSPSSAQKLYREMWFPKNKIIRVLLIIGGGAGVFGASLGRNLSRLGGTGWLVMAILCTVTLVLGTFYISEQLWRLNLGLNPIPNQEE